MLAAGWLAAAVASGSVSQAQEAPAISAEMIILVPHGHSLAVFQEIDLRHSKSRFSPVALFRGAHAVHAISGRVKLSGPGQWQYRPNHLQAALRYLVPWNGRSASLVMKSRDAIGGVTVLTQPSLQLPAILNPALAAVGEGKIPHVPQSPTFAEYVSRGHRPGRSLTLDIEREIKPPLSQASRVVGRLMLGLAGFAIAAALAQALYWRPSRAQTGGTSEDRPSRP